MKYFKAMKWTTLVSGILLAALGIISLFTPMQSLVWLSVVISISVLVAGIASLVSYFTAEAEERSGWELAEAGITTLIGIWMVFGSGSWALTALIPIIFAIFVIGSGFVRIAESLDMKAMGTPRWGWLLAAGIVCVVLGLLLFFAPSTSAQLVSVLLSLLVLGYGIGNIVRFGIMQRTGRRIRRRIREIKGEA